MNEIYIKKRKILLPAIITSWLCTVVYGFLRWLTVERMGLDIIKDITWTFFIPIVFALLVRMFLLRKNFRLLSEAGGRRRELLSLVFILFCSTMLSTAQEYIKHHFVRQINLKEISQVDLFPDFRYYRLGSVGIDKINMKYFVDTKTIHYNHNSRTTFSFFQYA